MLAPGADQDRPAGLKCEDLHRWGRARSSGGARETGLGRREGGFRETVFVDSCGEASVA